MSKALHNQFAFSFSKYETLGKCARQYYMNCYAHWNGWDYKATSIQKGTYRLKQLTSLAAWAGNIVHREIANTLNDALDGQPYSMEKSEARMREVFGREFKISEARASNPNMPAKTFGLKEHEFKEEITREMKLETWEKTKASMLTFHHSGVIDRVIKAGRKNLLSIEAFSTFPVKSDDGIDVPVYSVPDLAFREGDKVIIYDWKTGKEKDEYSDQIAMYALYSACHWNVEPAQVEANIFYLMTGTIISKIATQEWVESAWLRIKAGIREMRKYIVDGDIELNKPLPASHFPHTTKQWACKYCNFTKVCGVEQVNAGKPDPLCV